MPILKGTEHPCSKLTDQAVREIRDMYRPGTVSQKELATEFGVSQQMIARILAGFSWKHVTGQEQGRSAGATRPALTAAENTTAIYNPGSAGRSPGSNEIPAVIPANAGQQPRPWPEKTIRARSAE